MKNFVNIRVQAYNNSRVANLIKHDLRYNKNSLSQMNDNTNYVYCMAHEGAIESKELNKSIYEDLKEDFKNDKIKHNELYKKRTRGNLRDYHSSWANGVITFSEKLKHSLAKNEFGINELKQVAIKCLNEFATTYKCDLKYVALHMDETTPHFHFTFSNFNKSGHSILNSELKTTKQLRSLQDLAYKHFKELGMDRGIFKEITKKRYQTTKQYWGKMEQEAKMSFLSVLSTLEAKEKELSNIDMEIEKKTKSQERLDRQIIFLKERRKSVQNDVKLSKEERKEYYKDITKEQKEKREERDTLTQEIKELKTDKKNIETSQKELKIRIVSDTKNIVENSTNKYGLIKKDELMKNIHKYLSQYSNLNFTIKEINEVYSHLEEAHKENDNLTKSLNNERVKNKSLETNLEQEKKSKLSFQSKNIELERDLKDLSNDLINGDGSKAFEVARKYSKEQEHNFEDITR